MKKLLISTTALIAAGVIANSANAADNVTFTLAGSVTSTVAYGSSSAIKDFQDNKMGKHNSDAQGKYALHNEDYDRVVASGDYVKPGYTLVRSVGSIYTNPYDDYRDAGHNTKLLNGTHASDGQPLNDATRGSYTAAKRAFDMKNSAETADKDSYRNFDLWNEAFLEGTATYTNPNEEGILNSVTGHVSLFDSAAITAKQDITANVEVNTKFGNVIMGDHNFTAVMGTLGEQDDDMGSDYFSARHVGNIYQANSSTTHSGYWDSYYNGVNEEKAHHHNHVILGTTPGVWWHPNTGTGGTSVNGSLQNVSTGTVIDETLSQGEELSLRTDLSDTDLANDVESRIQYNTGDLIKIDENNKVVVGLSVAFNNNDNAEEASDGAFTHKQGSLNEPLVTENTDGSTSYAWTSSLAKTMVYAGGVSYTGAFGDTSVFAVGTFQHTDGANMFNVSAKVGLLADTLHINLGTTMKMLSAKNGTKYNSIAEAGLQAVETGDFYGAMKNTKEFNGAIMSFYGSVDYAVAGFTIGLDGHFGHQGHGKTGVNANTFTSDLVHTTWTATNYDHTRNFVGALTDSATNEMGFAARLEMNLAENVTWTVAKVNFDYAKTTGVVDYETSVQNTEGSEGYGPKTSTVAKKFDIASTAYGVQSVLHIAF